MSRWHFHRRIAGRNVVIVIPSDDKRDQPHTWHVVPCECRWWVRLRLYLLESIGW